MNTQKIQKWQKQANEFRNHVNMLPMQDQRKQQQHPQCQPPAIRKEFPNCPRSSPFRMGPLDCPVNTSFVRAEKNELLFCSQPEKTKRVGSDPLFSPGETGFVPKYFVAEIRRQVALAARRPTARRQRIIRSIENVSAVRGHRYEFTKYVVISDCPR